MENTTVTTSAFRRKLKVFGYKAKRVGRTILESPLFYLVTAGFIGWKISDNVMEHDYSATAKIGPTEFSLTKNPTQNS